MLLKEAIAIYEENDLDCLASFGGYPVEIDYETIPGYVVIASMWDGKPQLEIFTFDEFIKWAIDVKEEE